MRLYGSGYVYGFPLAFCQVLDPNYWFFVRHSASPSSNSQ